MGILKRKYYYSVYPNFPSKTCEQHFYWPHFSPHFALLTLNHNHPSKLCLQHSKAFILHHSTLFHILSATVLKILQTTRRGLSRQRLHFPASAFCSRDFCITVTEAKGWFCLTVSVLVHDDRKGMVNSWWWQCVLGLLTSWWTRKQRAQAKAITFKGSFPVTQL